MADVITKALEKASFDDALFDNKLTQLNSLLTCCYGVGAEWMEMIGEKHRDNILWIAANLAAEIEAMNEARIKAP